MPSVTCWQCGHKLFAPDAAAGRQAKCPRCKAELTIPSLPASSSPESARHDWQAAPPPVVKVFTRTR
jgi:hypothetical protein